MIPIGALVIMLLRNFIGVKTFGTFMPVLVALAFRETRLMWGSLLFAVIVSLGLLIRFYLEKLRLLLVPRLTCVLTVVVLLMAGISVLSQRLDLQPGLSIALFPMVIISMTIERMSIVWEERGASEAIQEGVGQPAGGRRRLPGHGHRLARTPGVRVPGAAAAGDRRHAAGRSLHRLSPARAAALQGAGARQRSGA